MSRSDRAPSITGDGLRGAGRYPMRPQRRAKHHPYPYGTCKNHHNRYWHGAERPKLGQRSKGRRQPLTPQTLQSGHRGPTLRRG